jgi:hypothetical protein
MSVQTLLAVLTLYLELGLVVALGFTVLVGQIDKAARGALWFRPLLLPGALLLWPLVLVRTVRALLTRRSGVTP